MQRLHGICLQLRDVAAGICLQLHDAAAYEFCDFEARVFPVLDLAVCATQQAMRRKW